MNCEYDSEAQIEFVVKFIAYIFFTFSILKHECNQGRH